MRRWVSGLPRWLVHGAFWTLFLGLVVIGRLVVGVPLVPAVWTAIVGCVALALAWWAMVVLYRRQLQVATGLPLTDERRYAVRASFGGHVPPDSRIRDAAVRVCEKRIANGRWPSGLAGAAMLGLGIGVGVALPPHEPAPFQYACMIFASSCAQWTPAPIQRRMIALRLGARHSVGGDAASTIWQG